MSTHKPLNACVPDLMRQMTPQEKVAQLAGGWLIPHRALRTSLRSLMNGRKLSIEKCRKWIPHGLGFLSDVASTDDLMPDELVAVIRDLQTFLRTETRLGIPAIVSDDAISGLSARGVTTFPQQLGIACTWNPDIVQRHASFSRQLMRSIGIQQALTPMLDIARDGRWGRMEESFGEEPYLTALMGVAFVKGLQGDGALNTGVAATVKHFAGHGVDAATGDPRIDVLGRIAVQEAPSMRAFFEDTLRPFEAAVNAAHAACVMPAYKSFKGVPCVASEELLNQILRERIGFVGPVMSDYFNIEMIADGGMFATGEVMTDASARAINGGTDICMPDGRGFHEGLLKAVERGAVSQETLDRSVERVLTLKAQLGLLENDVRLWADVTPDFDPPEARQIAYEAAVQSIVLVKNEEGFLPLPESIGSIALVGPNAAAVESLLGDYTHQSRARFFWGVPTDPNTPKLVTLFEGLRNRIGPFTKLSCERGCDWTDPMSDATKNPALKVAQRSDVIIAAMGENLYTCGEGRDRADPRLPGDQEAFLRALAQTGKPIVLVFFGGRAGVLTDIEPLCKSILMAWFPGEEGGNAVADVLLGKAEPSGKLAVTLPRSAEQSPTWHTQVDQPYEPLYPFGHGLSYSTFEYSNLCAPTSITMSDELEIRFTIRNTGTRAATEIAQVYIAPPSETSGVPAVLCGFARVELRSREKRNVTIRVPIELLARYDEQLRLTVQPGNHRIRIGASSLDVRIATTVCLEGAPIHFTRRRTFASATRIE